MATKEKSQEVLVESPKQEKDAAKQEWVCVSTGKYVKKEQVELLSQHDWLKIGFKQVDGSGSDGYLDPDAPPTFFTELVKSFDTDGNGELSSKEIQAALQDSGNAEQLHKLIVKHPSEWYEKSSASSYQWLDKLMTKIGLPDFDLLVDHEKQRIDKLEWMQSAAKLKFRKHVWHLHPLAIIQNKIRSQRYRWAHTSFANFLASVESNNDYSAYNKTTPKLKSFYKTDLTSLTLNELMQKQKEREVFAAGRYQIIPNTLKDAIMYLSLDISLKFDEETQDRIFDEYIIRVKRKKFIDYLEGSGSVEDAIYAWSMEFASAGVRKGKEISPKLMRDENGKIMRDKDGKPIKKRRFARFEGELYYSGDGLNVAHIMPDKMVEVLEESKYEMQ